MSGKMTGIEERNARTHRKTNNQMVVSRTYSESELTGQTFQTTTSNLWSNSSHGHPYTLCSQKNSKNLFATANVSPEQCQQYNTSRLISKLKDLKEVGSNFYKSQNGSMGVITECQVGEKYHEW